MRYVTVIILVVFSNCCYSQSVMSPKEAFLYNLAANKETAGNKLTIANKTYQWGDLYASYFDKTNYIISVNDEFKRIPYLTQKFKEINDGIERIDFNKTFYFMVNAPFDIFNSGCSCFSLNSDDFYQYNPTLFDIKEVGNSKLWYDNSFARISIGNYFNFNDLDYKLKMQPQDAEKFVASRKDNRGNINRNVAIKVIYNVVNKILSSKENKYYIGVYIHKLEFYDGQKILGSVTSKYDYFDKINLVKIRSGIDKIFLDKDWKLLKYEDSSNASYFRTITYKEGKRTGFFGDYFISGAKQMTGYIIQDIWNGPFVWYYENGQKSEEVTYYAGNREGLFISYYENGQKSSEVNFVKDKMSGKYVSWHSNGQKSEEVTYINGNKEGCDHKWDEKGKCIVDLWNDSADYYSNGEKVIGPAKCPCENK